MLELLVLLKVLKMLLMLLLLAMDLGLDVGLKLGLDLLLDLLKGWVVLQKMLLDSRILKQLLLKLLLLCGRGLLRRLAWGQLQLLCCRETRKLLSRQQILWFLVQVKFVTPVTILVITFVVFLLGIH
jgi:hypothetical protein